MFISKLLPTIFLLAPAVKGAKFQFPEFSGEFPVGTISFPLTDDATDDPLATSPQKRKLMVQLYYPTTKDALSKFPPAPYAPAASFKAMAQFLKFPNDTNAADIVTGMSLGSPVSYGTATVPKSAEKSQCKVGKTSDGKLPLVVFSHGFGGSRLLYNSITADLASNGYIVASIDHTFDSLFVEFPDGTVVPQSPAFAKAGESFGESGVKLIEKSSEVRVNDVNFVLNKITATNFTVPGMKGDAGRLKIDTSKIGICGHSLGGATAANVMLENKKFIAGMNMDGSFFGKTNTSATVTDLERPFMIMVNIKNSFNAKDSSMKRFIDAQKKVKTVVMAVKDSEHVSFSDLPVVVDLLKLERKNLPSGFGIGGITGERMNKVLAAYIRSFFNKNLKGDDNRLLNGNDRGFPEVLMEGAQ